VRLPRPPAIAGGLRTLPRSIFAEAAAVGAFSRRLISPPDSPSPPAWGRPGVWRRRAPPRPRRGRPGARLRVWGVEREERVRGSNAAAAVAGSLFSYAILHARPGVAHWWRLARGLAQSPAWRQVGRRVGAGRPEAGARGERFGVERKGVALFFFQPERRPLFQGGGAGAGLSLSSFSFTSPRAPPTRPARAHYARPPPSTKHTPDGGDGARQERGGHHGWGRLGGDVGENKGCVE